MQGGAYSKALRALLSNGVHSLAEDIKERLLTKHPQTKTATDDAHPFDLRQTGLRTDCTTFSSEETLAAIRHFPVASRSGGTNLTRTHLRELLDTNESNEKGGLLNGLAGQATHGARGNAHSPLAHWITGAP